MTNISLKSSNFFFSKYCITQSIYMLVILYSLHKWDILYDVYFCFVFVQFVFNILCAETIEF